MDCDPEDKLILKIKYGSMRATSLKSQEGAAPM